MKTINLTNPGQTPVDGDRIINAYDNGATEEKQYWTPVAPHSPTRREVVLARLLEIDATSDKPRTRRELALSRNAAKVWLQTLDDEAAALRAELAGL